MKNKLILGIILFLLVLQVTAQENVTKEDALESVLNSENIIKEMADNGLSTTYVEDILIEIERVLEQIDYAEILKSEGSTNTQRSEARTALRLVDWEELSYSNIMVLTNEIESRKEQSFLIFDSLTALQLEIEANKRSNLNLEEVISLTGNANTAFYEDRYEDSQNLLIQAKNSLENAKAQTAALYGMQRSAQNFIQRYWSVLLIIILVLTIAIFFFYKRINVYLLKKKIKKMKVEKDALQDLMKKAQFERFKENKISGIVYNIRTKKYQEKINEIKEELPVLESKLKKTKSKKK
jgi:hypothetical protein